MAIVIAAISLALYVERGFSEIRSDLRDLKTRMAEDKENTDLKLQNLRLEVEKSELRKALLDELKTDQERR